MKSIYTDLLDFHKLKTCIIAKRTTIRYVADDIGIDAHQISHFINGVTIPKSDTIAKICSVLEAPVSEIVEFKGIEYSPYFETLGSVYDPPLHPSGDVTYEPLWNFLKIYLKEHEGKTSDDLFDKIEPYRRRSGIVNNELMAKAREKSFEARGIDENFVAKVVRTPRRLKGLTEETRTKLRHDRPLQMRTIYDICKFLGCPVNFVMSYK